MRESWTDQRLDDFTAETRRRFEKVDKRFDNIEKRFEDVDKRFREVDKRFSKVEGRLDKVDSRFEVVDQRFDMVEYRMKEGFGRVDANLRELRTQMTSFQRSALQLGVATMVTLAIGFLGVITQL